MAVKAGRASHFFPVPGWQLFAWMRRSWMIWPRTSHDCSGFGCLPAPVAIFIWKPAGYRAVLALAWVGPEMSPLPVTILTDSRRPPKPASASASVGLATIVGFAVLQVYQRYWSRHRLAVVALCGLMVAQNVI